MSTLDVLSVTGCVCVIVIICGGGGERKREERAGKGKERAGEGNIRREKGGGRSHLLVTIKGKRAGEQGNKIRLLLVPIIKYLLTLLIVFCREL